MDKAGEGLALSTSPVLLTFGVLVAVVTLVIGVVVSQAGSTALGPISNSWAPSIISTVALIAVILLGFTIRLRRAHSNVRAVAAIVIGAVLVLIAVLLVNGLTRFSDCGPGGNLVVVNGRYAVESRNGLQYISNAQHDEYSGCNATHAWLTAFAATGVASTMQFALLIAGRR